jgi:hypothetical protein
VPLAMVNLIDEHSLIVKSADGQAPGSVPRNISFCGHTILTEAPLVVGDMRQDDRFADNPLVAGEPACVFTRASRCACETAQALARCA